MFFIAFLLSYEYIFFTMNDSNKFLADARRIIKFERAQNGGRYNAMSACRKIAELFIKRNAAITSLAESVSDYWLNNYVMLSQNQAEEPSDENLDRICAMQNFLEGIDTDNEILTDKDWHELADLTNYEAEDMPLDLLNSIMTIVVDKGAL